MSSRKRKTIRRERRDALIDELTVKWLSGADPQEHCWDSFYEFYENNGSRKWGHPYLNREFFSRLNQSMADSIVLMLAYDSDAPIAGAINFVGKDRIFGRNWGCIRNVPFSALRTLYTIKLSNTPSPTNWPSSKLMRKAITSWPAATRPLHNLFGSLTCLCQPARGGRRFS